MLAFTRTDYHQRSGDAASAIYLMDADGGRVRRLPVNGNVMSSAWAPDGRQLVFVRLVERDHAVESELVVAGLDGSGEQVLFRERPTEGEFSSITEPAWSPDGSQVAFTRTTLDKRFYFRPDLYVVSAQGADAREFARDAAGAAWSPDGRRIAFASIRDRNGHICFEDECAYKSELYVMDRDGMNLVRLTRNRGDDRSPSWSADGRRIVFASDRNSPDIGGSEIYSMAADGSCLTWLTNGSPQSVEPDWSGASATAGACGARPRHAVVQVDTRRVRERHRERAYWLGDRYRGRLLDHASSARDGRLRHSYFFNYGDCGRYQARACVPELQLQEVSVCSRADFGTLRLVAEAPHYQHAVRAYAAHGLLFVDIGQHDLAAVIGTTQVRLFPGIGGKRGRRVAGRALLDLREVGKPAGPLPGTALPAALLESLRRTDLALERSGSVGATARSLGIPVDQVRRRLELSRGVASLPRVRAVACPS
jgi:dipeptidyl aminopeptidase/acylaminoacyl peptidase